MQFKKSLMTKDYGSVKLWSINQEDSKEFVIMLKCEQEEKNVT
jgi:hypothetical protein